ncbi:MAG TPA: D-glycero-beta-D-manno-heptose-7-phosphate kinase [Bdellovibrionales bacterium]|nr:D-glycero-beta-D-manno-heptose-7-phosphate kinase [Bdellovibrionales bacterium]
MQTFTNMKVERFKEILSKFQSISPILVVGDIGIDKYTFGEVTRISPEAPVPVVVVTKEWPKLGLASNISHNLTTLQIRSTICGVVGNDPNAQQFEHLLEENGLSTWGVVHDPSRPTTYKERVTTNIQQICRIDYEKVHPLSTDVEQKLFSRINEFTHKHGPIILEDYAKGTLTDSLLQKVIALARKQKRLVAIDPYRTRRPEVYRGANLLKPNLAEGKMLAHALGMSEDKWENISSVLLEKLDIDMIAMTLGADGMLIQEKGQAAIHIPTVATEVFDVSGAGDTTISVLVGVLSVGGSLAEAAVIGNCAAGVVVGKKGTATVSQEELLEFFQGKFLRLRS